MTAAIEASGGSEAIPSRLQLLERVRGDIKARIAGLIVKSPPAVNVAGVKDLVNNFMDNFEKEFERAQIEERKALVKKIISEIIVDHDRNTVRFYVRRIPAVLPVLDDLMKKERELTKPVSSQRSGGTLQCAATDNSSQLVEVGTLRI